jgi:pentatricopeptide repeat protein
MSAMPPVHVYNKRYSSRAYAVRTQRTSPQPRAHASGARMQTAGSARGVASALALLREMKERGIPRTAPIYAKIMGLCVRADQLQTALGMYEVMLEEQLEPTLVSYHTLIDAYGQLRQWQQALSVLDIVSSKARCRACSYRAVLACVQAAATRTLALGLPGVVCPASLLGACGITRAERLLAREAVSYGAASAGHRRGVDVQHGDHCLRPCVPRRGGSRRL